MSRRILFYSHDTYGIGNIRRTSELCQATVARFPEAHVLVITSSPHAAKFSIPKSVDVVKLPELTRTERGRYDPRASGFIPRELCEVRSEICRTTISGFRPDVLVVDKAPLGVAGELKPALEAMERENPGCVSVLALRDILDDPQWIRDLWNRDGTPEAILRHYKSVWAFGSPGVFDLRREYRMSAELEKRVSFLGFLGRNEATRSSGETRRDLCLGDGPILLTTVGGGEDGGSILSAMRDILPQLRERFPELISVFVTGPRADKAIRSSLEDACAGDSRSVVFGFTTRIMDLMHAASAVVCMGGYNTACELLLLGKPALMIPRSGPVFEQRMRATRLAELGVVRTCDPDRLTDGHLIEDVSALLNGWQPVRLNGEAPFTGLELATDHIATLFKSPRALSNGAGS